MFHSFQMQKPVDEEMNNAKRLGFMQIDENFSRIFLERETQNIGGFVLASINAIEPARESMAAENERKIVIFSQDLVFELLKRRFWSALLSAIGNRERQGFTSCGE